MMVALLAAFLFTFAAGLALRWLNLRHLVRFGHQVPAPFEGRIDPETLRRTADYTAAGLRVGLLRSAILTALATVFFFGGLLGVYDRWISSISESFVGTGVVFFLLLFYARIVLSIPFNLYKTFVLEDRYGFNKTTPGLWIRDLIKSLVIGSVLVALTAAAALWLIRTSPDRWWVLVWGFFCALSIFLIYLSPYVIEPLFVKFEPVTDPELVPQVRQLARKAGFSVSKVLKVDASRRTGHSNAYFTGIGRVKRIVLFDTLLNQMSRPEILAVLAHEAGHWKKMHIPQRLAATALTSLTGFYLAHVLLSWEGLPGWVGLETASFYARVAILALAGSVLSFMLTPLAAAISRFQERQADRYACELTRNPQAMASALATLTKENLSNIHPHPVYAWFSYSHPPVVRRIRDLS